MAFPGSSSIMTSVHPTGLKNVTAYVYSTVTGVGNDQAIESVAAHNDTTATISQRYKLTLIPDHPSTVHKYIGIASTDHFTNASGVARNASIIASKSGWDALLSAHSARVAALMAPPYVADFRSPDGKLSSDPTIQALQITARASAYYLYTSLLPEGEIPEGARGAINTNSLAVGGLTSEAYGGKIFWDADLFMAPPIQASQPRLARQFSTYRVQRAKQASENTVRHGMSAGAMLYPWTSGRNGECYNITGPCVMYEYHLNADIALSLVMARNTSGDLDWFNEEATGVIDGVARGLAETLTWYPENGTWGIEVMTDADEYYMFVSDGAFTDSAISVALEIASNLRREFGKPLERNWINITENMQIPTSETGVVLEFRNMWNDLVSKQADVILMDYPFDYRRNFTTEKRRLAMDYSDRIQMVRR
ncbi:Glycoside hydrolase family 65 central catalytic [Macrophomina phaseolina MS6]|uniref:Glycoside hydrolase family 65 central catalytic n=1 Tax=Macrophomina phaseolina (strain MS6) TaxID=1126212 RepID=K2SED3_MACPH|nr:Glycoside hydrolase family 65 central catalytic [Macrophomina phaseolina MS6]